MQKITLRTPPAESKRGFVEGVMRANARILLEEICCAGKIAGGKNKDDALGAALTAQYLADITRGMLAKVGMADKALLAKLSKCTACAVTRYNLAHSWVDCKPLKTGLPDCPKLTAQ